MSSPKLDTDSWLSGGFPGAGTVTKKQRLYINRRAHLLREVLSEEQQVALRMMRFDFWLKNLSKLDASAIISRMHAWEGRKKEERIARGLARKMKRVQFTATTCSLCGGELEEDPVTPTCRRCGKGAIRVQM